MKSCGMLCGIALGMAAGAAVILLLPTRRTAGVKRQMKRTMQDIEDVMEDAMDGIHAILCDG